MSLHPQPLPGVPEETARVGAVNRLEGVGETLRHALNSLAVTAPEWVQMHCPAEWVERYGRRVDDYHLPTKQEERQAYAEGIGADGHALMAAIYAPQAPRWLRQIPAVEDATTGVGTAILSRRWRCALAYGKGRHSPVGLIYQLAL